MLRKQTNRALRLGRSPIPQGDKPGEPLRPQANAAIACGWGRLIASHTFANPADIAQALLAEQPGQRDIAFYLQKPHVVVAQAPHQLFVDPSEAYRLNLSSYRPSKAARRGAALPFVGCVPGPTSRRSMRSIARAAWCRSTRPISGPAGPIDS